MFALQALQDNGSWYTVARFHEYSTAEYDMKQRGSYKRATVRYRIVRSHEAND